MRTSQPEHVDEVVEGAHHGRGHIMEGDGGV